MNTQEHIRDLYSQWTELKEQESITFKSAFDLKASRLKIENQIISLMETEKATKYYDTNGSVVSIKSDTDRTYDTAALLALEGKVPAELWNKAYKCKSEHKFTWAGLKALKTLGGSIAEIIENATHENTKKTLVITKEREN